MAPGEIGSLYSAAARRLISTLPEARKAVLSRLHFFGGRLRIVFETWRQILARRRIQNTWYLSPTQRKPETAEMRLLP